MMSALRSRGSVSASFITRRAKALVLFFKSSPAKNRSSRLNTGYLLILPLTSLGIYPPQDHPRDHCGYEDYAKSNLRARLDKTPEESIVNIRKAPRKQYEPTNYRAEK